MDDPGCDLAIAAALASAASGRTAPAGSAFVGEISLTGQVRPVAGMVQRAAAAKARKLGMLFAPRTEGVPSGVKISEVSDVREALDWAIS